MTSSAPPALQAKLGSARTLPPSRTMTRTVDAPTAAQLLAWLLAVIVQLTRMLPSSPSDTQPASCETVASTSMDRNAFFIALPPNERRFAFDVIAPVSYTHLRAHETP